MRSNMYPDGEIIPLVLPMSYQFAAGPMIPMHQRCSTCASYNADSSICKRWYDVKVRPTYWCKAWTNETNIKL